MERAGDEGDAGVKLDEGILTRFWHDKPLIYLYLFLEGEEGEDNSNILDIKIEQHCYRGRQRRAGLRARAERNWNTIFTRPKFGKNAVQGCNFVGEEGTSPRHPPVGRQLPRTTAENRGQQLLSTWYPVEPRSLAAATRRRRHVSFNLAIRR